MSRLFLHTVTVNGAKKFLFVSDIGCIGDLAFQMKNEGSLVRYCILNKKEKGVSDGFVEKVDDWEKHVDWADVIIFDDIGFGSMAEKLRKEGKAVVGGTPQSDKLELDRDLAQEELKAAGINTLPNWDFSSFDEAIKFVRGNPGRYVIKPNGKAQNEKVLSFVGQEEDGLDLVNMLERYKTGWGGKIRSFQLQKFVAGVEVAIGAFFNGQEFLLPACINFEHKRMFNDEIGPTTGEMGCYDEETEVLTLAGWKRFTDVGEDDLFATLHPESEILEYHRASRIVRFKHHNRMVQIRNRATDLLVTLDHNMFGQEGNQFRRSRRWGFLKAKNLPHQFAVPRSARWIGREESVFVLPAVEKFHRRGKTVVPKLTNPIFIPMDLWLAFLGLWIAEGWTSDASYQVGLAAVNPRKLPAIQKIIEAMPFRWKKVKGGWKCYDKQLWTYLKPLGKAHSKFIPAEFKQFSPRQLAILFDTMCLGDGNLQRNGFRIYYTSSPKLADDVQEILLKLGRVGQVKSRYRKGGRMGDRPFVSVRPCFEVIERVRKTTAWIDRRDTEIVPYAGTVYCVTVPYHTLYIRRTGKAIWCGNTSMFWAGPNRLYNETLKKFEKRLSEIGFIGYFDINCIVNSRGIYPLEITPRFGYPTINIQMEGITSPWSDLMFALARRQPFSLKAVRGYQIGVVVAVPPYPYDDPDVFEKFSEDAVILFKKTPLNGIHHCDVKLQEGDWRITGSSGYILVVTGSGPTMPDAQREAYNRIRNIILPNMFYRTDIGSRWSRDGDLLQTWGLLAA